MMYNSHIFLKIFSFILESGKGRGHVHVHMSEWGGGAEEENFQADSPMNKELDFSIQSQDP